MAIKNLQILVIDNVPGSKLFIACQINLNQITCNHFLFSFTIYIKTLIIRHMMETHLLWRNAEKSELV
jgi:hypothetical protein